ncbi:hypothetical protein ACMDCR_20055 [Labrys okinawensis]|uniref:hypothetical protein n=1 Tax=Labrys okinawensis TaxID=346911 RepID=UPI0039BCD36D
MMLATVLAGFFLTAPAHAAPATPEGAKAIADSFAHYYGRKLIDKGIATVTPNGDHYDVTFAIDNAKLGLPADGPQFQFAPFTMQMTQKGDGTYAYTADQSIDLTFKAAKTKEPLEFAEHLKSCSGNGVLDLKRMVFLTQAMTCESTVLTVRSPVEDIDASMGKLTIQGHAKPGASDGIDIGVTGDLQDFVETVTVKDPRNPSPPVAIRADRVHQEATAAGIRNTQLLEALAFFVDHDFTVDQNDQAAAQAKLKAMLPLWQDLKGDIRYDNASVGTPKGIVKIASVDSQVITTGAVKDTNINQKISFSGLELPDGMVPDWAGPLVPRSATLNFRLTGLDLDLVANKLIEVVGASKAMEQHEAIRSAILAILFGSQAHLSFEQSLTAPAFDVKGQGESTVSPTQRGKATVSASSLDAVMDAFTKGAASTPNAQQGVMGVAFLKGLAKTGPDGRLTWDIDFDSAAKTVTVNGQTFGPGARKP